MIVNSQRLGQPNKTMGRRRSGRSNPRHSSGEHPQTGLSGHLYILVSVFPLRAQGNPHICWSICFSGDQLNLHHRLLSNQPMAVCNDGTPARFGLKFKVPLIFFQLLFASGSTCCWPDGVGLPGRWWSLLQRSLLQTTL